MTSYHNSRDGNLFPSTPNVNARRAIREALPSADPDLVALHVNAAERQGFPLSPPVVQQLAQLVREETAQQRAAASATYERSVRRYGAPPKSQH